MKTLEHLEREIASLKQTVRERMRRDARHRSDPAVRQMRRRLRRWQRRRRALLVRQGAPRPSKKGAGPAPPDVLTEPRVPPEGVGRRAPEGSPTAETAS